MPSHVPAGRNACFGPFEADLTAGELFRDGNRLSLQDKPFRLLEILLRSGGRLVERERMMGEVWPGIHVGQRSINTAIRKLRRALDDNAASPQFIETVGSRGHRMMVPVEFRSQKEASRGCDPMRLIIMPFQNLGSPDDNRFTCAFNEQMIVQMRRAPQDLVLITPAGQTRKKDPGKLSPLPGRETGADYVLNGSVLSGARNLRITARLGRAGDQLCLWSESYSPHKRDVLEVQDEISRKIARAVIEHLPIGEAILPNS